MNSAWPSMRPAPTCSSNKPPKCPPAKAPRARPVGGAGSAGLFLLLLLAALRFRFRPEMDSGRHHFPVLGGLHITGDVFAHDLVFECGGFAGFGNLRLGSEVIGAFAQRDRFGGLVHSRKFAPERM